jgi:hypothetical protein
MKLSSMEKAMGSNLLFQLGVRPTKCEMWKSTQKIDFKEEGFALGEI